MSLYMAGIISVTLDVGRGCCLEHLQLILNDELTVTKKNANVFQCFLEALLKLCTFLGSTLTMTFSITK